MAAQPPQYQYPNTSPNKSAGDGREKPAGFETFEEVPWEQGATGAKSQPHATSNAKSTTSFFTHPRTWSRKKKIIISVILLGIIVIIIGAAAGTAAHKKSSRICTCPGWTDSFGVYYPATHYICDASGYDLTTQQSNPCGTD
jgi:hypothetical protein